MRSLVGRFLEHSPSRKYYIGSADLMPRNLDRRVEAVVPVGDAHLKARLQQILDLNFADDTLAWQLHADGTWHKVAGGDGVNAQSRLQELAFDRARRCPENKGASNGN